jgi:hypothetical protein
MASLDSPATLLEAILWILRWLITGLEEYQPLFQMIYLFYAGWPALGLHSNLLG